MVVPLKLKDIDGGLIEGMKMIHFFPSPIENEEEIKLPLCEGEHNMYGFTGGGCFSRVMWAAVWF